MKKEISIEMIVFLCIVGMILVLAVSALFIILQMKRQKLRNLEKVIEILSGANMEETNQAFLALGLAYENDFIEKCAARMHANVLINDLFNPTLLIQTKVAYLNKYLSIYSKDLISVVIYEMFADMIEKDKSYLMISIGDIYNVTMHLGNTQDETIQSFPQVRDRYIKILCAVVTYELENVTHVKVEELVNKVENMHYLGDKIKSFAERLKEKHIEQMLAKVSSGYIKVEKSA